jgi:hypothetical protein
MLPVGLTVASWMPVEPEKWGSLLGLATVCGLTNFFSQLGRDQGKAKEAALFESWGGKPTTRFLSHSSSPLNAQTLERYHKKLKKLRRDFRLPTAEEEAADPVAAKTVYESCVDYLLERTRDTKEFALVFSENVNYGFRRNLWGMRPAGLSIAVLAAAACFARTGYSWWHNGAIHEVSLVAAAVCVSLGVLWTVRITPGWVRLAGEAYAQRLLAALEKL